MQDKDKVFHRLIKDINKRQSDYLIPTWGLFHTSSSEVTEPFFCIFQLKQVLEIEGMDKTKVDLSRMLVMLAPSPIDEATGKLLGKISGALIMNDLNTEIFRSGNETIIYQLLSKNFDR